MPKGPLGRDHKFIAEPLIEHIIKQEHAGIHIEPTLIIQDLVA